MTLATHRSYMALETALNAGGVPRDYLHGSNESLITRARNSMAASFLETDHTHLMWIDADIEFSPDDVAALWNMDVDVAVGVYAMKKPDAAWYAAWVDGELVKDLDRFGGGPVSVDYAGTGFMMIRRDVLEKMIAAYPETAYEGNDPSGGERTEYALFDTEIREGAYLSEDYLFCQRWRDMGGEIRMNPKVRLRHIGQYAFGACG